MTGFDYFTKCLYEYANFEGRASRSEYWYFILFQTLFVVALSVLGGILGGFVGVFSMMAIWYLATMIPTLAVGARRLHDMGQSAWFLLLSLVPLGNMALVVMYCLESEPGTNKWGPNPNEYYEQWFDDDEVLEDRHYQRQSRYRDDDYV